MQFKTLLMKKIVYPRTLTKQIKEIHMIQDLKHQAKSPHVQCFLILA